MDNCIISYYEFENLVYVSNSTLKTTYEASIVYNVKGRKFIKNRYSFSDHASFETCAEQIENQMKYVEEESNIQPIKQICHLTPMKSIRERFVIMDISQYSVLEIINMISEGFNENNDTIGYSYTL